MIIFTKEDKTITLDEVLDFLNTNLDVYYQETFPGLCKNVSYSVISAKLGSKFIKLIQTSGGNRSCYAFLDKQGNIYKSASWAAPAKHIRGSVFDADYGWGTALNHYGAMYLK